MIFFSRIKLKKKFAMEEVYASLGIHTGALGCVKLYLEALDVTPADVGGEEVLYTSSSPLRPWVAGMINTTASHATLIYGLLDSVKEEHVHAALAARKWTCPSTVHVRGVHVFPSPACEEDPYVCIVAVLDTNDGLREANDALFALPHICRHPVFKAHVTIAYIKAEACTESLIAALNTKLLHQEVVVLCGGVQFEPAGSLI